MSPCLSSIDGHTQTAHVWAFDAQWTALPRDPCYIKGLGRLSSGSYTLARGEISTASTYSAR